MNAEPRAIPVGLGELKISNDPREVLVAYGLGSCLGVGMYDPAARVGGLLHAVLPECNGDSHIAPAKFVDSGLAQMLTELAAYGAAPRRLVVRLAGGANMLTVSDLKRIFNIGERNIAMGESALARHGLKPEARSIGGTIGRTFRVYLADGRMTVRMIGEKEHEF